MKPAGGERGAAFRPNWTKASKWLVTCGKLRGLPIEDARQFAQQTILHFLDPEYARYEVGNERELFLVLGSILNGLLVNHRRHEAHGQAWLAYSESLVDPEPSPEDRVASKERAHVALTKLAARVKGRPLVEKVVALMLEGVHGAAEQAERLGEPVARIYEARSTIAELVENIEKKLGGN